MAEFRKGGPGSSPPTSASPLAFRRVPPPSWGVFRRKRSLICRLRHLMLSTSRCADSGESHLAFETAEPPSRHGRARGKEKAMATSSRLHPILSCARGWCKNMRQRRSFQARASGIRRRLASICKHASSRAPLIAPAATHHRIASWHGSRLPATLAIVDDFSAEDVLLQPCRKSVTRQFFAKLSSAGLLPLFSSFSRYVGFGAA